MTEPIRPLLDDARRRLAQAPREAIGALVQPRRMLGIARAPRVERRGTAWHLGTLLLTDDGLLAVGAIVRARAQVRRGYAAQSQRDRAALEAAARRGGFAEGETVHLDWHAIDLDAVAGGGASGPVRAVDGAIEVRWSPAGGYQPLTRYLDERIALLLDPPLGAG